MKSKDSDSDRSSIIEINTIKSMKNKDIPSSINSSFDSSIDARISITNKTNSKTAYIILLFLGLGNLLPWYAFVTAQSYFASRFCGSSFSTVFENFFSITYTLAQPFGLLISLFYGHKIPMTSQVRAPLYIYFIIFLTTTITVFIDITANPLFIFTLFCTTVCGFTGAVMNGGLFGIAGLLPSNYTSALMTGSAFAGLSIALASYLTEAAEVSTNCTVLDDDYGSSNCSSFAIDYGAVAYFATSTFVLLLCIVLFEIFLKLPFFKYYTDKMNKAIELDETELAIVALSFRNSSFNQIVERVSHVENSFNNSNNYSEFNNKILHQVAKNPLNLSYNSDFNNGIDSSIYSDSNINSTLDSELDSKVESKIDVNNMNTEDKVENKTSFKDVWEVLKVVSIPAYSVFITYSASLAIFPGILVLILPINPCTDKHPRQIFNNLWVPFIFALFNGCDLTGRFTAEYINNKYKQRNIIKPTNIHIFSTLRCFIIILYMFCNIKGSRLPNVLVSDAFPIFITIFFAFTNGLLANLSMMFGPTLVEFEKSSLAGTIMVFGLTLGLLFGSIVSFALVYIARGTLQ